MTHPVIKTAADEALEAVLKGAQGGLAGEGAFASLRADAISQFEAEGLPNKRVRIGNIPT